MKTQSQGPKADCYGSRLPRFWDNLFLATKQMGDSVLLIPENAKYEPINVKPDQVRINGVVIGVLKEISR